MRVNVTGLGVVSALGVGVAANYDALSQARSGLGELTLFDTHHAVPVGEVKWSNDDLKTFLQLPRKKVYSRTALLGMLAAREAFVDAHIADHLRIGLVSATSVGGMDLSENFYKDFQKNQQSGRLRYVVHHDSADSTNAIADLLGITDFATTISTACSSSANAIMLGARLIRSGMLDVVVAGGCDALCKFTLNGFQSLKILDTSRCRPFDNTRAGLNLGEGAGYVVLQRGDLPSEKVYGSLVGSANTNDAYHQTASSQSGDGAFLSMEKALKQAGLSTTAIDYVNVHGTGTTNNDASEGAALRRLFGEYVPKFSSTKAFTGHTLAAAGGIEAVFSLLALQHGALFPNLNFATPMAECPLVPETAFSVANDLHHVMSNSFGFGGNCSTLVFSR